MPIDRFTLNNFVCPIPLCQPEADLGSILDVFRYLNCKLLAIPQDNSKWGIIYAEDLLSLIAKVWLQKKTAVVGHPKMGYQENLPNLSAKDFNSIVRPAIVCQADTKLPKFLSYLQHFPFTNEEFLIVNATGKLQGRLNTDKMLKYLASRVNPSPANIVKSTSENSTPSLSLIDAISLPLKIETIEGESVYHNQCWQKLIISSREKDCSPTDSYIASWWMEQQSLREKADNQKPDRDEHNCESTDCRIISDINISSSKTPLVSRPTKFTAYSDQTNSQLSIQIEQARDWNYIKIPWISSNKQANNNTSMYWIVLATKLSIENFQNVSADSLATGTSVGQLLETVAHELKSPITGIVGLTSLLKERKLGKLDRRQTNYIKLISNSGRKTMGIVKDLIELTRLTEESPKSELINLPSLCQQTYKQVINDLQLLDEAEHNSLTAIKLDLTTESATQTAIADLSRLSSILSHLIVETIQFSKSADVLSIKIKQLPGATAIEIANNRDHDLLSASESTIYTSLNLVIAKYLAEILKGKVTSVCWIDCCRFTLTLPQDNSQYGRLSTIEPITAKNIQKNLTILCLYPEPEAIDPEKHSQDSDFELKNWSSNSEQQSEERYRVIEADGLEQADILARIWQLDVIVLNGYQIIDPSKYLRSLQRLERLSALPLITLDTRTTEAANQVSGLRVYPCLLPAQHRNLKDLMQVIQIATGSERTTDDI